MTNSQINKYIDTFDLPQIEALCDYLMSQAKLLGVWPEDGNRLLACMYFDQETWEELMTAFILAHC